MKKHIKPNPMKGTTGGIVDKTMPIHHFERRDLQRRNGKADRVGIKVEGRQARSASSSRSGAELKRLSAE